jgi:hypothetical protein
MRTRSGQRPGPGRAGIALIAALWLTAAAAAGAAGDPGLVPPDGTAPGWARSGPPKVYGPGDLYNYIDGGAELFLEFGFEALTLQHFQKGEAELAVEVYRMTDPAAGVGIYLAKCGREQRDPGIPARHTVDAYQLMLQQSRYLVIVNNLAAGSDLRPVLAAFGQSVARLLPRDAAVPLLKALPAEGQLPDTLRLVRGPYGLSPIFTFGDGNILSLGRTATAAVARFGDGAGGDFTRMRIDYPSEAAARDAFRKLVAGLDPYLKVLKQSDTALVFADYSGKFGILVRQGARFEIRVRLKTQPPLPPGRPSP